MTGKRKILCVVGTRPEAIKMAPVIRALQQEPWADVKVIATAQHRDLLDGAFATFGISADIDLDLMRAGQSLSALTGRAFATLAPAFEAEAGDMVIAQGDTTTVMVAAVTAFYLGIPFSHVEAGLRTGDIKNPFPEEINRIFASKVTTLHFTPTHPAAEVLLGEDVPRAQICVAGNTVIDSLLLAKDRTPALGLDLPDGAKLILMTAHRRENFGPALEEAMEAVRAVVDARLEVHVLYPVHPNPNVTSAADRILGNHDRIHLTEPMEYEPFIAAMKAAHVILTDSGGVQEEAPALGKPVLVMRNETERPEAVDFGVVHLVGTSGPEITTWLNRLLDDPETYRKMSRGVSPYGDGLASQRIVQAIADYFDETASLERIEEFSVG